MKIFSPLNSFLEEKKKYHGTDAVVHIRTGAANATSDIINVQHTKNLAKNCSCGHCMIHRRAIDLNSYLPVIGMLLMKSSKT